VVLEDLVVVPGSVEYGNDAVKLTLQRRSTGKLFVEYVEGQGWLADVVPITPASYRIPGLAPSAVNVDDLVGWLREDRKRILTTKLKDASGELLQISLSGIAGLSLNLDDFLALEIKTETGSAVGRSMKLVAVVDGAGTQRRLKTIKSIEGKTPKSFFEGVLSR
jgi:hypothetical protein